MPFDGSGNFTRSYNFVQDKANNIKIVAARMDGEFDNYATAMNQVLLRNGVAPLTDDLRLGNNGITGLEAGSAGTPGIRFNNDTTTGLYMPAAGEVALSAAGVQRLRAHSAGVNVAGLLYVTGSGCTTQLTTSTARGGGANYIAFYDPTGQKGFIGYDTGNDRLNVINTLAQPLALGVSNTAILTIAADGTSSFANNLSLGTATADIFGRGYTRALGLTSSGAAGLSINAATASLAEVSLGVNGVRTMSLSTSNTTPAVQAVGALPLTFTTNGVERGRFTDTGNFGIGVASPGARLAVGGSGEIGQLQTSTARGSGNCNFGFYDPTGRKGYVGYGGSDDKLSLRNLLDAPLTFSTANSFISFETNSTERGQIDASGTFFIGNQASISGSGKLRVQTAGDGYAISTWHSADFTAMQFVRGVSQIGTIGVTAASVAYNTTSDYRLKIMQPYVVDPGDIIDNVPVYTGYFIAEPGTDRHLFKAHELQNQVPYAVTGEKDDPFKYQQVDNSKLVPILWAEVQNLRARLSAAGL